MNLTFEQINGVFVVNHRALAQAAADYYEIETPEGVALVTNTIKNHLNRLEFDKEITEGSLIHRNHDRLCDKEALYQLAQIMHWDEDFTLTFLVAMGEWGEGPDKDAQDSLINIYDSEAA